MFKRFNVFFSPNDASGTSSNLPAVDTSVTDKDILNQGDDDGDEVSDDAGDGKEEEVPDEDDEEESEEEESEEDGDEEEDSSDEESDGFGDDDSDVEDFSDLTKAVKKAAPDLFKKVPGLREALERDKEFGEVFSTPEEAKLAAKNSGFLEKVYSDISSGDVEKTGNFLKAIKNTNEEAFEDFSHVILESIVS